MKDSCTVAPLPLLPAGLYRTVGNNGHVVVFNTDTGRRHCLMNGEAVRVRELLGDRLCTGKCFTLEEDLVH